MGLRDRLKKANAAAREQWAEGKPERDAAQARLDQAKVDAARVKEARDDRRDRYRQDVEQHKAERAEERERLVAETASAMQAAKRPPRVKPFAGIKIEGDVIRRKSERHPITGVEATVETAGSVDRRFSLTRTAGGALALGPPGALIGAIARKKIDQRQAFLLISGPDFAWAVEFNADDLAKAHEFAAQVTTLGRTTPPG